MRDVAELRWSPRVVLAADLKWGHIPGKVKQMMESGEVAGVEEEVEKKLVRPQ